MQVTTTLAETWELLDAARAEGKTVGLAPTMGFLHAGHASLIQASAAENDVTLTTIFVNPLQFGADEDLSDYPRDLERDLKLCQKSDSRSLSFVRLCQSVAVLGPTKTTE